MMRAATVLGGGSFGTAIAVQLARLGHDVLLWDRNPDRCAEMNHFRRNPRYLPDLVLPDNLRATDDLAEAASHAELLVTVVPSHALRGVMRRAKSSILPGTLICCATKGIEEGTLETMSSVLAEELPEGCPVTVFSGPTFAEELAAGRPTTVVVAGDEASAATVADAFHGGGLRVYHTDDVIGVCLGGSLKNVIAIACGITDGLGLGQNARAALITRGLAEITRLTVAMGGEPITMMGLAGLGDLVLTCTGSLSRNRRVGIALGEGKTLQTALNDLGQVAEGVITARSAYNLARKMDVEMPIVEQVYAVLYEGRPAKVALAALMGRERKAETEGLEAAE